MSTIYPVSIDNTVSLPSVMDNITGVNAISFNNLRSTIIVIEGVLGINPASVYGTVAARLDALEAAIAAGGGGGGSTVFGGDLFGVSGHQVVIGLQNRPVSATAPIIGQFLGWNGTMWLPASIPPGFTAGGDLTGTNTVQTVGQRKAFLLMGA